MTIALAIEYIPRRMNDIGIGTNYYTQFKHFIVQPLETLEIDADNQFFIQVDEVDGIRIESDFGIYDLSDTNTNELKYEHQGKITLYNYSASIKHIRFIQIIPKH